MFRKFLEFLFIISYYIKHFVTIDKDFGEEQKENQCRKDLQLFLFVLSNIQ